MSPQLVRTGAADATEEKLAWVKEAAGARFEQIELGMTIFRASVTDDREAVANAVAPATQLEPRQVLEMPHVLIGTIDQMVEDLQARRQRFGFSHIAVPGDMADALAPVVERLAGN